MAKARDIAALAGLAGLAYANRDKLFGGKKTYNEDAGDQKTSSYTGDTKKVAASDDRMSNEDYIKSRMKKAPEDADEGYKSSVLKAVTATKEAPNYQSGNQGVLGGSTSSPKPKPKPKPRVMTGAQNTALANAGKQSSMTAESDALAKANLGASTSPTATTAPLKPRLHPRTGRPMEDTPIRHPRTGRPMKDGGAVKMASGGMTASSRADGIATKGKTRGKIC